MRGRRQQPQTVLALRGGGLGLLCSFGGPMGLGHGTVLFWVGVLVLRGRRGRQPVWFIFGLYEGCPSCYVETATPKA
jgi:hypothetical protein